MNSKADFDELKLSFKIMNEIFQCSEFKNGFIKTPLKVLYDLYYQYLDEKSMIQALLIKTYQDGIQFQTENEIPLEKIYFEWPFQQDALLMIDIQSRFTLN